MNPSGLLYYSVHLQCLIPLSCDSSVTDEDVSVAVQDNITAGSTIGNEGLGQGHEHCQPYYLATRYCVAITGIFPSWD